MTSLKLHPTLTAQNAPYSGLAQVALGGDLSMAHASRRVSKDLAHKRLTKSGLSIALAARSSLRAVQERISTAIALWMKTTSASIASGRPSALLAVVSVLLGRSDRQMRRLEAPAHVAGMLNLKLRRDRAYEVFVGNAVYAASRSADDHAAVAVTGDLAGPQQAISIADAASHETVGYRDARILAWHRANSSVSCPRLFQQRGGALRCNFTTSDQIAKRFELIAATAVRAA